MSEKKAKEKGLKPLAKNPLYGGQATTPRLIAAIPGFTIQKAFGKGSRSLSIKIDLIEVNEAFAAMPLVKRKDFG